MLALVLAVQIQAMVVGQASTAAAPIGGGCRDGDTKACTLAGCCRATQTCVAPDWQPCVCESSVGQSCGTGTQCTAYVYNSSCQCTMTIAVGAACNDSNACTANDRCDTSGKCAGTPIAGIDDQNPCTFDRCDPATGAITHPLASAEASCSSGTFYCHDKYGNVTRKVVCVAGQPCDTFCR